MGVNKTFEKGDYFGFSYNTDPNKEIFLFRNGFYDPNLPSIYHTFYTIDKKVFNFHKYKICVNINCLDNSELDFFYESQDLHTIVLNYKINSVVLDKKLLSLMRILVIPTEDVIDVPKITHRLANKLWISYKNEMLAFASLRSFYLSLPIPESKYSTRNIIQILATTECHFNRYKARVNNIILLRYKYKLRKNILQLALETKKIFLKQFNIINKNLIYTLADQFKKIKNQYTKEEEDPLQK